VVAKVSSRHVNKIKVIPNFVDADRIVPMDRMTSYRRELNIGDEIVVMYAGNVGYSQSLTMLLHAAKNMPSITFVINGDGAARAELETQAAGLPNIRFAGYQPRDRVGEVLASGDIHVVPLRTGLGAVSVPSKTYSILAAARPVVAAIDAGTEVTRILDHSGAGVSVTPDDEEVFTAALQHMVANIDEAREQGRKGRQWVETHVSPAAVAQSYLSLIADIGV
jgi:colanic acid biosynthesis glycosyl transferase WcaI